MKKASELLGKKLIAKVELVRYRFPSAKKDILPGKLSIAVMSLNKVIKGDIPSDFIQSDGTAQFIIKGFNIPVLDIGQEYLMTGNLTQDNKWGYQYNISEIHMDYDLTKVEDQRKMLSYFLTDLQIDLLYQNFDNPAKLLEEKKIGELTKIKGIGPVTALKMCERYVQCRMNGRAYVVFGELGLTKNAIDRIVEHYGSVDLAVDAVEANPYTLIKDVRGYGWNKADEIAQKKGFLRNCKERVQAFAQYYLQEQADINGFSCVLIEDLMANIASECSPITNDTIGLYIKEVTANAEQFDEYMKKHQIGKHEGDHPQFFYDIKSRRIGLFWYRVVEKDIFTEMQRIRNSKNLLEINDDLIKNTIDKCQKQIGFEYTDEQTKAIYMTLKKNLSIITGSAGTGKSNSLKPLISILQNMNLSVAQTALSGRASSLLSSVTGIEGKTIHRLLKYNAQTGKFNYNKENPMPYDVVILDESSMVGEELFLNLISAVKDGAKFIMLGDIKQLPPLNVGNILSDSLRSGYIDTTVLTKIHRQASQSGIISEAIKVSLGEGIIKNTFQGSEIRGALKDFKIISAADSAVAHYNIVKEFKDLFFGQGIPANQIQIVVPMRSKGDTSCRALNEEIQEIVNPGNLSKSVSVLFTDNGSKYEVRFKKNDRIIINRNNYHAIGVDGKEHAVFNGNLGYIKDVQKDVIIVKLDEEDQDLIFSRDDWYNLNLAYAITVHKCVTEDTILYTENGYQKIEDFNNGAPINQFKEFSKPIKVYDGDRYTDSTKFFNGGKSKVLTIQTQYGYQLKCSPDHYIMQYKDGEEQLIEAENLKIGDYVCLPINFNYNLTDTKLPAEWNIRTLDVRSKLYIRPTQLTEKFAEFLGLFVADGCLSNGGFHYYKKDLDTVQRVQLLTEKLFGYSAKIRKHSRNGKAVGIECCSKDIKQFLSYIDGLLPNKKDIPQIIQKAQNKYQCAFLRGLFEGGTIHLKKGKFDMIELGIQGQDMARKVQLMLQQNGIISSLKYYLLNRYSKIDNHELSTYKIMIYGKYAKEFYQKIGFINKEKQEKLSKCLNLNVKKECSHSTIIESESHTKAYIQIESISQQYDNVYCLYVPKTHMFVQNGLLGGNCQGSQAKYVITGIDYSAYALLSRELVYTTLTRASKYCVLVAQPKALNLAVHTSAIKNKITWLKDDLTAAMIEENMERN